MGNNLDHVTLHKYLYANADPVSYTDPTGQTSLISLGRSLTIVGTLTTISNVLITSYAAAQAGENGGQSPDAAIFTFGGSVGSGGAMAEAGADLIYDFRTGKAWAYGTFGVGLSPLSLFRNFRSAGTTTSLGLIWNFNNPNDWSGFSVGANWPVSILHLLPPTIFGGNKMWGAMSQLAKRAHNTSRGDFTFQVGVSTGGPVALKLAHRSNSFSTSVGFGSNPVEVPAGAIADRARLLARDFGNGLDSL